MPTLRDATPADAPAVARLFLASRRAFLGYLPMVHSDAATEAWLAARLGETDTLLAEKDGEIVGFLMRDGEDLDGLYLLPGHTGRGIGAALLARAQAATDRLTLYTFARNAGARRFYARHGFVETDHSDGGRNEEGEPDVLMVWERRPVPVAPVP